MRLLFILENYYPNVGGVETLFQGLMENFAKKGHSIELITQRLKGTKKYEELNGVKIHRTECFGNRYLFSFFAIPKAVAMAKKCDVIHTTTYNGGLPAIVAAKITGKPVIITVHEILGKYWDKFEMSFLSKKFHQFVEYMITKTPFDRFAAVSYSTKRQLKEAGVKENRIEVVYDGVDYELLKPEDYDGNKIRKKLNMGKKFIYIAYGRPGITKGIEYLVKAVPLVEKKIKNSQLVLVLSERDKRIEYIKKLIKKLNLENKIILLKSMPKKELMEHIKAADLVVAPSLTEGFGYSVIEACEMGKIVVATNTTSIPEIIYGKYVLVKPGSAEALATGIEMAHKNKVMKGKRKLFTIEDNAGGYMRIYKEILRKK